MYWASRLLHHVDLNKTKPIQTVNVKEYIKLLHCREKRSQVLSDQIIFLVKYHGLIKQEGYEKRRVMNSFP